MSNQSTPNKYVSRQIRVLRNTSTTVTDLEVTFYLTHNQEEEASKDLMQHPSKRKYADNRVFKRMFTTENTGIELLKAFLAENSLTIIEENSVEQTVKVSGTLEEFSNAFKVSFSEYVTADGKPFLSYSGDLAIPADLEPYILTITGLEKGLVKGTRSPLKEDQAEDATRAAMPKGYSPQEISSFYNFPGNDASGECIGLVELGGNYKMSDIEQYCAEFGLPIPNIVEVGTKPQVPASAQMIDDLEVTLDIQMVAGLAQKAKIVIYYASSIPEAMHLAVNDTKNNPSVLSISWAISEYDCSLADRKLIDQLSYQATLKGITVIAASGDHGAYNSKSFPNVMLPASNPFVLGCGGTETYISTNFEQVWNSGNRMASGGGYSIIYPIPGYQQKAIEEYKKGFPYGGIGRGVPDISGNSAPETPYTIVMNGKSMGIGAGTSASTPVWASLIAVMNKNLGYRLGWINKLFYELESSPAFKQVLNGNNDIYPAAYGWNAATGLGTPSGVELQNGIINLERSYAIAMGEPLEKEQPKTTRKKPAAKTTKTTARRGAAAAKKAKPAPKKVTKKPATKSATKPAPKKSNDKPSGDGGQQSK